MPTPLDRDWDLLAVLREREPTAAETLINAYGDRAYRLAIGITGNGPDAEEVVQDAFWSVVRKIDTSGGIRPSDPGSIASSPTPPTGSSATARTGVT